MAELPKEVGIVLDPKLIIKIEEALRDEKETYIQYFISDGLDHPNLGEFIERALSYTKELGYFEYHPDRVQLEAKLIILHFNNIDMEVRKKGFEKLKEFESKLSKKQEEFRYLKKKSEEIQYILLQIGKQTQDINLIMKYAPSLLEKIVESSPISDEDLYLIKIVFEQYVKSGQSEKIINLCKKMIESAKPRPGKPLTENYEKALDYSMETFQRIGNYKLMVNYISPWVE